MKDKSGFQRLWYENDKIQMPKLANQQGGKAGPSYRLRMPHGPEESKVRLCPDDRLVIDITRLTVIGFKMRANKTRK